MLASNKNQLSDFIPFDGAPRFLITNPQFSQN